MSSLHLLRWRLEAAAARQGLWILPGALALALALAAWGLWIPRREAALEQAVAELAQSRVVVAEAPRLDAAPPLPGPARAQASVRELFAIAAGQGLHITQAEYRRQVTGQVGRWQVQVPARGSYPQVRRVVRAAAAIPGLSLDQVALRPEGEAGAVEARLLFSVWFSVPPGEGTR